MSSGIYLLFKDRQLTYIGKSQWTDTRVRQHRANGREFDFALQIPLAEHEMDWIETELIKKFQPPQNSIHTDKWTKEQRRKELERRAKLNPPPTREQESLREEAMERVNALYERPPDPDELLTFPVVKEMCSGIRAELDKAMHNGALRFVWKSGGQRVRLFKRKDVEAWRSSVHEKIGLGA